MVIKCKSDCSHLELDSIAALLSLSLLIFSYSCKTDWNIKEIRNPCPSKAMSILISARLLQILVIIKDVPNSFELNNLAKT